MVTILRYGLWLTIVLTGSVCAQTDRFFDGYYAGNVNGFEKSLGDALNYSTLLRQEGCDRCRMLQVVHDTMETNLLLLAKYRAMFVTEADDVSGSIASQYQAMVRNNESFQSNRALFQAVNTLRESDQWSPLVPTDPSQQKAIDEVIGMYIREGNIYGVNMDRAR